MGLFGNKSNQGQARHAEDQHGIIGKVSGSIKEKVEESKQIAEKQKREISTVQKACIRSGKFQQEKNVTLWMQDDGMVYFGKNVDELYEIVSFSWDGPKFSDVTTSQTTGKDKGKSKRTGRVIGATVGTLVAPGIGTAIGAALGTGNKKSKGKSKTSTVTSTDTVEVETVATVTMREVSTEKTVAFSFKGLQSSIIELQGFAQKAMGRSGTTADMDHRDYDPYDELKKLKELLDMEIISRDEFDAKKREMLGL